MIQRSWVQSQLGAIFDEIFFVLSCVEICQITWLTEIDTCIETDAKNYTGDVTIYIRGTTFNTEKHLLSVSVKVSVITILIKGSGRTHS